MTCTAKGRWAVTSPGLTYTTWRSLNFLRLYLDDFSSETVAWVVAETDWLDVGLERDRAVQGQDGHVIPLHMRKDMCACADVSSQA